LRSSGRLKKKPLVIGVERLKALSATGDPLERRSRVVDFEVFRDEQIVTVAMPRALLVGH
jgi:hypothetical protein